jgi:hypothetical protein
MSNAINTDDLVERLIRRLPSDELLTVTDVCAALNRHPDVVNAWIQSGEVYAVDLGGGGKSYWQISRASLCDFLRRRTVGMRVSPSNSLHTRQLELFANQKNERK